MKEGLNQSEPSLELSATIQKLKFTFCTKMDGTEWGV